MYGFLLAEAGLSLGLTDEAVTILEETLPFDETEQRYQGYQADRRNFIRYALHVFLATGMNAAPRELLFSLAMSRKRR